MGNRLSRITTRTGDDGTTGLAGNQRVAKNHPRVEALGDADELNSFIGLLLTESLTQVTQDRLVLVQHHLFGLGGELAMPEFQGINAEKLGLLDGWIEDDNARLPPLKEFVLPGGNRAAALAHVCRTVCRRAERRLVDLSQVETISPLLIQYLNRLSDWLFILARTLNAGNEPDQWKK